MKEFMDKLLELQSKEVERIRTETRLNSLKRELSLLQANLEQKMERKKELLDFVAKKKSEIKDVKDFINHKKGLLEELKKRKEYASSRNEYKEILRKIAKIEDEIIKKRKKLVELEEELEDFLVEKEIKLREIEQEISQIDSDISMISKKISQSEELLEKLAEQIDNIKGELPEEVVREYEALKERYNGLVFSDISSGACDGCGMHYSSAEYDKLLKELKLGQSRCPYCGRFIFVKVKRVK